jgi:hypothetical protein
MKGFASRWAVLGVAVAMTGSAGADDQVTAWNEVLLEAVRLDRTAPPIAARNMAIVHIAIFDAVNAIERGYEPYAFSGHGPRGASAEAAVAAAAHRSLVELFPAQKDFFDEALVASLDLMPDGPGESAGVAVGKAAASYILKLRRHDGWDHVVAYTPGTEPGDWQPTPPANLSALLPQWPAVAPFCMTHGSQFRSAGPPLLTSSDYAMAYNEVKSLGARDSMIRSADQTQIALFWADGPGTVTPPGHWNVIAQQIVQARSTSLVETARLFALLNIALADAGICAWDSKYEFDFWRPITAIRNGDLDGNDATEPDPTWTPLIATPPFPSYTSGHSTFSAAGAAVLAVFFKSDDISFTTTSDALPGVVRSFASFSDAAAEAGMSRIYGGIHWNFDNLDAIEAGSQLGIFAANSVLRPRE